jgi:hypothetical protein
MKGKGYGKKRSWPNLNLREKPKKYQSYVPNQNTLLQKYKLALLL